MAKCPVCGTPATDNDIFCSGCGQRLPPPTSAPAGAPAGTPGADQSPLPPMPGPPPASPIQATPPRQQTPVIQPSYQQPVTASYGQSQPQQPSVVQPTYGQAPPVYGQQPLAAQPPGGGAPPKKKSKGCLIAAIVAVALGVCGAVVGGGFVLLPKIIDPGNPTTTPYSSGNTTGPNSGEAPLDVINNLGVDICYLYISPSTSEDWGDDWLGASDTIGPGFSATFYVPVGETVDMQAEDCDGYILDTQYDIYVTTEGLTYTLSP